MIILALDPSLTKTGYAVGTGHRQLIEHGLINSDSGLDLVPRARRMVAEVEAMVRLHKPECIAIELPAHHVHGRVHGMNIGGLAKYGFAVGWVVGLCDAYCAKRGARLIASDANEWTNRSKKRTRVAWVSQWYPAYQAKRDRGGDMADAISLMEWAANKIEMEARLAS